MAEKLVEKAYKVVVLGDACVGKTALILRYVCGTFNPEAVATIGIEFLFKKVQWQGKDLKLQIWDTVGLERFAALSQSYCRDADAAIFCYDVTYQHSFLNINKWLYDYLIHKDCPMVLVGCKSDLERERVVSTEDGQSKAESLGFPFFETSAMKENLNIDDIFTFIVSKLADKEPKSMKKEGTINVTKNSRETRGKKASCRCRS